LNMRNVNAVYAVSVLVQPSFDLWSLE
jgi:hypothetical protein